MNRTYIRFMVNTRSNDDGFRGEYPKPLDWKKIREEILENQRPADAGEQKEPGDS